MLSCKSAPVALRACAASMLLIAGYAVANPTGPQVTAGTATFTTTANRLTVTNSPNAIIHWQSFSISAGQLTQFVQQSASSAVLNRVIGMDMSRIQGTLTSNGKVFLVNPNGVLISPTARIDTAAFTAMTSNLSDQDFLGGKHDWTGTGSFLSAAGVLSGDIRISDNAIRIVDLSLVSAGGRKPTLTIQSAGLIDLTGNISIPPDGDFVIGSPANITITMPPNMLPPETVGGSPIIVAGPERPNPGLQTELTLNTAPITTAAGTLTLTNSGGSSAPATPPADNTARLQRTVQPAPAVTLAMNAGTRAPAIAQAADRGVASSTTMASVTPATANPLPAVATGASATPAGRTGASVATISLQKREPLF